MLSNNSKNKIGDVDPFNKGKLADEAKRDQEKIKAAQKQQEKNKLQLQIDNRKRELLKIEQDLRLRRDFLNQKKKEIEAVKRGIFLTGEEIKKQGGGVNYLAQEAQVHDRRVIAQEAELQSMKVKQNNVLAEINKIKKEITERESTLVGKNIEAKKLDDEIKSLEIGAKQISNSKLKTSKNIDLRKEEIRKKDQDLTLKKRVAEELEQGADRVDREIVNLERESEAKKQEIKNLEAKRDAIKF